MKPLTVFDALVNSSRVFKILHGIVYSDDMKQVLYLREEKREYTKISRQTEIITGVVFSTCATLIDIKDLSFWLGEMKNV